MSHVNPNAVIVTLISAAIARSGATEPGLMGYDLRFGSLIGPSLGVQVGGQIIGSLYGVLISCGMYKLYASQYAIPGPLFTIPSSYLVLSTARLLLD